VRAHGDCTYNGNGANWSCASSSGGAGAFSDLPSSLTRGAYYLLAGSSNNYGAHVFEDAASGTSAITIYKAVDCTVTTALYCPSGSSPIYSSGTGPQTIAGWSAEFGTATASWVDTAEADPEVRITPGIWDICTDYYTFDGITGSTLPGSVGGQGFRIGTQNSRNLVELCDNSTSVSNISFNHMNVGGTGPAPYWAAPVTSCSYTGGVATIGTQRNIYGINGDSVSAWTSALAEVFSGASTTITPSQVEVAVATNPCPSIYPGGSISLYVFPSGAFSDGDNTGSLSYVTVENCYIHDMGALIWLRNAYNITIVKNYLARNYSTPFEHDSPVEFTETSSAISAGPVTFAFNFMIDGEGTAGGIVNLNTDGTLNELYVYSNIFTCSGATNGPGCGGGDGTVGAINNTNLTNSVFYHNTVAGVTGTVGLYAPGPDSAGNLIKDNLFYNTPGGVQMQEDAGYPPNINDYNTLLNAEEDYGTRPAGVNTCFTYATYGGHETCISSGAPDPFVDLATYNFHLVAPMSEASTSGTATAEGEVLPAPFNVDFYGVTFGSTTGLARGAVEYNSQDH
jgi:hypothetical protein